MKSKKQERKRYNLGRVRAAKHFWGFTTLVFNYLESRKTYRQKCTGDETHIFNFLYKFITKYCWLRQILSKTHSGNSCRFSCKVLDTRVLTKIAACLISYFKKILLPVLKLLHLDRRMDTYGEAEQTATAISRRKKSRLSGRALLKLWDLSFWQRCQDYCLLGCDAV
jgi:hypothetical protein